MNNFQDKVGFLWSVADEVLRDDFKRGKYPDVILPFTVLRRLDCVLAATKSAVRQRHEDLTARGLSNLDGQLRKVSGYAFYNTSPFDFPTLLDDPKNIGKNLRAYINGFSENMRDIIEKFKLRNTIDTLDEKGLLFLLVQKFSEVDLHPDRVDNHTMGTMFEELIRRFNEQANENPGEHFTPREVIRLMVRLMLEEDTDILKRPSVIRTVYDPACGSGGMLSIAKEYVLAEINAHADIRLFGQEVNDETYAIAKSDLLIKGDDRDAEHIKSGSCLSQDGHRGESFDYMIVNPPYGKDWKKEKDFVEAEAARGTAGRFAVGTPRVSDGQMLFLQHLISKMKPVAEGGSRIAIVMNGSPLFTGDAGSGESEIRRWVLENDWLETLVSLPGELFYNTGITTYVWILTNRKAPARRGKVLLVHGGATRKEGDKKIEIFAQKLRRSLGDKRNELSQTQIQELVCLAQAFEEGEYTRIFQTTDFGYRRIQIEHPLRLNFQTSPERCDRLETQSAFIVLAQSKKAGEVGKAERELGQKLQQQIRDLLAGMDGSRLYKNRNEFEKALDAALRSASVKVGGPVRKAILTALSERDETADICTDAKGCPEADPELRDYENVPLAEDIFAYFEREVRPHVPDAWINESMRDEHDGKIGKVGYEINFNRHFYAFEPPRSLTTIDAELKALEREIQSMLEEVTT